MNAVFFNIDWKKENLAGQLGKLTELKIEREFMKSGFLFIWSEKSILAEILDIIEKKGFKFLESISIVQLDSLQLKSRVTDEGFLGKKANLYSYFSKMEASKAHIQGEICDTIVSKLEKKVPNLSNTELERLYLKEDCSFVSSCKKTLLMFRRVEEFYQVSEGKRLEIRRKRHEDAFFDIASQDCANSIDEIGIERVYRMIETLLPKAKKNPELPKLAEIGGHKKTARPGWITFCLD